MALTQRINHGIAPLDRYVDGVKAMRAAGTYHKYVYWHSQIGGRTDTSDPLGRRNAAHRGPAFLPWHRELLWRFEADLKTALGDADFGLPYWNWARDRTDGALATSKVWDHIGANTGALVLDGTSWTRMSAMLVGGVYQTVDLSQDVRREFNAFTDPFGHISDIRTVAQAESFAADTTLAYDAPAWNMTAPGFRNTNERDFHDHPHVLVGGNIGDMSVPARACNDPIFFMHHAMIDRLWAHWQQAGVDAGAPLDAQYRPTMSEASGIQEGHRIDEPMWPWNDDQEMSRWGLATEEITPRMVLDHRSARLNYVYDDQNPDGCLPVAGRIIREILSNIRFGRSRG